MLERVVANPAENWLILNFRDIETEEALREIFEYLSKFYDGDLSYLKEMCQAGNLGLKKSSAGEGQSKNIATFVVVREEVNHSTQKSQEEVLEFLSIRQLEIRNPRYSSYSLNFSVREENTRRGKFYYDPIASVNETMRFCRYISKLGVNIELKRT